MSETQRALGKLAANANKRRQRSNPYLLAVGQSNPEETHAHSVAEIGRIGHDGQN